jgi:hypothetical protein
MENFGKTNNIAHKIQIPNLSGVSRPTRNEIAQDLISFVKMFHPRSLVTGGSSHRQQITSPKMFERIFNIPVDPDDFEIDVDKTNSTKSGKRAFESLRAQGRIIEKTKNTKYVQNTRLYFAGYNNSKSFFIKPRSLLDNIAFDEFFVTVSTIGEFVE